MPFKITVSSPSPLPESSNQSSTASIRQGRQFTQLSLGEGYTVTISCGGLDLSKLNKMARQRITALLKDVISLEKKALGVPGKQELSQDKLNPYTKVLLREIYNIALREIYAIAANEIKPSSEETLNVEINFIKNPKKRAMEKTQPKTNERVKEQKKKGARGLKKMKTHPLLFRPGKYKVGEVVGSHIYKGRKRFGVEPGFEGTKAWTSADDRKLNELPEHHFYKQGDQYLKHRLLFDEDFQKADREFLATYPEASERERLDHLKRVPDLREKVISHLMHINRKFYKRHYLKLDYNEPDPDGKVRIDYEKAHGRTALSKSIHRSSTAGTPREKNLGAVMEALSNDIFTVLGFGGQKLRLIPGKYQDGTDKLVLDGTHVEGEKGEAFSTLHGQIKYGRIENNQLRGEDGKLYPIDTRQLGQSKIKALLMADRDKVGSEGDNIGYVVENGVAIIKNIDPGKSQERPPSFSQDMRPVTPQDAGAAARLRYFFQKIFFDIAFFFAGKTDRMTQKNIHTDFSFDFATGTIKNVFLGKYPNFTIFDDTKLSEKMEGMRVIISRWDEVMKVFDEYIEEFTKPDSPNLNFKEELYLAKKRLQERKVYLEEVFAERLKLNDRELDFLQNIETLPSKTFSTVGKKGELKLKHLGIDPAGRKEFHMVKATDGGHVLTFTGKDKKEAAAVQKAFIGFIRDREDLKNCIVLQNNILTIKIPEELFATFNDYFNERNISDYKKQPLG